MAPLQRRHRSPSGLGTCLAAVLLASVVQRTAATVAEAGLLIPLTSTSTNWADCTASLNGSDWSTAADPCNPVWKGLFCENGAVTTIKLAGLKLQGSFPASLAQLSALKVLKLDCNAYSGTIPAEWTAPGAFPALEVFNVGLNRLRGPLVSVQAADKRRMIASLSVNVSRNVLTGSLPAQWQSSTLEKLNVAWNSLTGTLPTEWGESRGDGSDFMRSAFPALTNLNVEGNAIWGALPGSWDATAFAPEFNVTGKPGNPGLDMEGGSSTLSAAAIAGIAVGAVLGVALLCLAAALFIRRRRRRAAASQQAGKAGPPSGTCDLEKGGKLGGSVVSKDDTAAEGHGFTPEDKVSSWLRKNSAQTLSASELGAAAMPALDGAPSGGDSAEGGNGPRALSPFAATSDPFYDSSWSRRSPSGLEGASSKGSSQQEGTDWSKLPADWNSVSGSELELARVIGEGSFGQVWLARYCQTPVAVKILGQAGKAPSATASVQQRSVLRELEKEAGLMRKLRHPNVCAYLGVCTEPPALLLEYCSRRSVDLLLKQGREEPQAARQLTWPRLLNMAADAARGVLYLHTRSPAIAHRDLKSANLLVDSKWSVKVADFNLSRALDHESMMSTLCITNPRWLAPEVLAGGQGGLAADVWAFGTVMWELLTWQLPFSGMNPFQIINAVQAASTSAGLPIPSAEELPGGAFVHFAEYVEVMQQCWQRDPTLRPSMGTVATKLRALAAAEMRQGSADVAERTASMPLRKLSDAAAP